MSVSKKNYGTFRETGRYDPYTGGGGKQVTDNACESNQISNSTDKDFKVSIIYIIKELQETIIEEIKEGVMIMSHPIENINKKKLQKVLNGNSGFKKN